MLPGQKAELWMDIGRGYTAIGKNPSYIGEVADMDALARKAFTQAVMLFPVASQEKREATQCLLEVNKKIVENWGPYQIGELVDSDDLIDMVYLLQACLVLPDDDDKPIKVASTTQAGAALRCRSYPQFVSGG